MGDVGGGLERLLERAKNYKAGNSRVNYLEPELEGFPEELGAIGVSKYQLDMDITKRVREELDRVKAYVMAPFLRRWSLKRPSENSVTFVRNFVEGYRPKAEKQRRGRDRFQSLREDLVRLEQAEWVDLSDADQEAVSQYHAGLMRVLNLAEAQKVMNDKHLSLYQEAVQVLEKI